MKIEGLLLGAINLDDAVGTDHSAAGAADASILVHHFKVVVTLCIYMFGKRDAVVRASGDAHGAAFALFRVND